MACCSSKGHLWKHSSPFTQSTMVIGPAQQNGVGVTTIHLESCRDGAPRQCQTANVAPAKLGVPLSKERRSAGYASGNSSSIPNTVLRGSVNPSPGVLGVNDVR